MARHDKPEYEAPSALRCDALIPGHPSYSYEWARHDHRCPRKANQMRGAHQVCWQHAAARSVTYFKPETERATQ